MQISPVRNREFAQHGRGGPESPEGGFTLVELLLVVVVLGILAAIVVFSLGSVQASAAVSACEANVATVQTAVSAYNVQTGGATPASPALLTSGSTPYLQSFPSSADYAITLVNGVVLVAGPSTATPVLATSAGACTGAGSGLVTTSSTSSTTTSSTTSTTTTTVPVSNGVVISATGSAAGSVYYGTDTLSFSSATSTSAITIAVRVNQVSGITPDSAFDTFGTFNPVSMSVAGVEITYVYTGSISPYASSGSVVFQFFGNGQTHNTALDTWSVTSTHGGVSATQSGHF